jgi:hypothetical protein
LIEYGEIMKNRKAEKRIEKLKQEETTLPFKPNISRSTKTSEKSLAGSTTDFLQRIEYHKLKKEKKLESIKSRIIDPDVEEYTFKPNIGNKAKQTKRSVEDLYVR